MQLPLVLVPLPDMLAERLPERPLDVPLYWHHWRNGGELLAMKGSSAGEEIDKAAPVLRRLGGTDAHVTLHGQDEVEVPTTVVHVRRRAHGTEKGGPRG